MPDPDFRHVSYESLDDGPIVRIMLDRPEYNATPSTASFSSISTDAFTPAEADDQVRVVILWGPRAVSRPATTWAPSVWPPSASPGADEHLSVPDQRWFAFPDAEARDVRGVARLLRATPGAGATCARSPWPRCTGRCIAAGLMLMWACDLIVAAEGTVFADVVGTRLGMCGVEYFAHPWEFGPRKTKELLLTGDSIDRRRGVPPRDGQQVFPPTARRRTLEFARRIARSRRWPRCS